MREIRFRQAIFLDGEFSHWHYWGFIAQGEFISPLLVYRNQRQDTQANSKMFAGLKDKNRVEIYEGDIVNYQISDTQFSAGEVKWSDIQMRFFFTGHYQGILDTYYLVKSEVIGNIYENKELLNEKEISRHNSRD